MNDSGRPPSVKALFPILRKLDLTQDEAEDFAQRLIAELRGRPSERHEESLERLCAEFISNLPPSDKRSAGPRLAHRLFANVSGGLLLAIAGSLLPDEVKTFLGDAPPPLFEFDPEDLIFVGGGSCADAALVSAAAADAVAIVMQTPEAWAGPGKGFAGPLPRRLLFDTGRAWANRLLLSDYIGKPARRVFFAGDIPRGTAFQPPPVVHTKHAIAGASPRQLYRLALEELCRVTFGFETVSLHDVYRFPECDPISRGPLPDAEEEALLTRARADFLVSLFDHRHAGTRPPPDPVSRSRDTALVAEYLQLDRTVILRWWREHLDGRGTLNPFDTAFLDTELVLRYMRAGIRRIVVEPHILLLDIEGIRAACREHDLDLVYTHG